MIKPNDPRALVIDLLPRSICSVQVAAVICDSSRRILSWGWNSVGSGLGIHAEAHAIQRANKDRLWFGTIYVASLRRGKPILSKPCDKCQELIANWEMDVVYRDSSGHWQEE